MNIEEVKEILEEFGEEIRQAIETPNTTHMMVIAKATTARNKAANQICQLSPKTEDNPDGYEVKLGDKDSIALTEGYFRGRADGLIMGEAECQQKVKQARQEMVEEIEKRFEDVTGKGSVEQILAIPKYRWQELKRKWGVK